MINTSFNVHEEPIVCNPVDAIKAFKESRLDFLYIGDYVVEKMIEKYDKFLIFVAHPDDEVLGCGGVLKKLSKLNKKIRVVVWLKDHLVDIKII